MSATQARASAATAGPRVRRDREPGLDDVHAEVDELGRHAPLLAHGHAAPGRLLAVAQRGVEDQHALSHRTASWSSGDYGPAHMHFANL
jgi:hypothetical protein